MAGMIYLITSSDLQGNTITRTLVESAAEAKEAYSCAFNENPTETTKILSMKRTEFLQKILENYKLSSIMLDMTQINPLSL